jgi:hypothetical protein
LEAFAYNSTTRTPRSFPANDVKFVSDRTIMKGTILVEKVISQLYLDFQWRDLPKFHNSLSPQVPYKWFNFVFDR